MKPTSTLFTPPLAEVQARFAEWRKNKKHQRRIPEELWTAAVGLSFEHSIHKISTSLSLGYADLKKRVEITENPSSASPIPNFIPIEIAPNHHAECIIEIGECQGSCRFFIRLLA